MAQKDKRAFKRPRTAVVVQQPQKSLLRQGNTVRGGPEKKNVDNTELLTVPIAGTAVLSTNLCLLATGTTANQRVGRKVKLVSFDCRWTATLAPTSVGGSPLRIKVVYDKQSNGTSSTAAQILQADSFTSPNNLDNADRFITIADIYTEPLSVNNNFSICGHIHKRIDLEQMNTGAAANPAGVLTGGVQMFIWQNSAITVAAPAFNYVSRIRFVDN